MHHEQSGWVGRTRPAVMVVFMLLMVNFGHSDDGQESDCVVVQDRVSYLDC